VAGGGQEVARLLVYGIGDGPKQYQHQCVKRSSTVNLVAWIAIGLGLGLLLGIVLIVSFPDGVKDS
jgi:hypothetical protein